MTGEADLAGFVRGLPKAELHLHIEGTLEPEMLFELAGRNRVELPFEDEAAVRAAYSFTDLQSFLDIYYQGAAVLQTEQDFYDLMAAYLRRAHADGVRRAEMFFDPQTHTGSGVGFEVFMEGFTSAMTDAEASSGISSALIMCFLRHLPGQAACETFRAAEGWLDGIIGVGLDSSEVGHPPEDFAEAYAMARAAGLRPVAHAGEEGPPAYIPGALDARAAERIDHGVRCEEDPDLVARLVAAQTPLTVCPLSNLALRVVDDLADHNLKRLLDAGLKVTINSDDPAYFGGYVADNYVAVATALGLSREDLAACARNSLEATFAPEAQKQAWLAELDAYLESA
ncbi:MAG: adenosine deaminase [Acidimicrobiaceae bacterium]|nr:adenosine deaminase [Acidimicrobiaceae bacterium]